LTSQTLEASLMARDLPVGCPMFNASRHPVCCHFCYCYNKPNRPWYMGIQMYQIS